MRHRVERARNRDAQSHAPTSPVCPKRATVVPQPSSFARRPLESPRPAPERASRSRTPTPTVESGIQGCRVPGEPSAPKTGSRSTAE
jgi:hypothetical protein